MAIADERGRRRVVQPEEEDVVRTEIEAALRGRGRVVPVLVDDAALPSRDALPRPFRPITSLNAVSLRHASWDQDLEALVGALAAPAPAATAGPAAAERPAPDEWEPTPGGPGESHYSRVAKALSQGELVPVLGAGVHAAAGDGTWEPGCGRLPDAAELAGALTSALQAQDRLDRPCGGRRSRSWRPTERSCSNRSFASSCSTTRSSPRRSITPSRAYPACCAQRTARAIRSSSPRPTTRRSSGRSRRQASRSTWRSASPPESIAGASSTSPGTTLRTARSSRSTVRTSTSSSRSTTKATCPVPSS